MAIATRLHERGRAAIALVTGCMVLACTVLALRHEASVAHAHDAVTGAASHGKATECREGAPQTHVHKLPGDQELDVGVCALTAVAHQVTQVQARPALVAADFQLHTIATVVDATPVSGSRLFRVAPKTSPPRA